MTQSQDYNLTNAQIDWFNTGYSVVQEISNTTLFNQLNPKSLMNGINPDDDLTQAQFNPAGMYTDKSEIEYSIYDSSHRFVTHIYDYEDLIEFIQKLDVPEDFEFKMGDEYIKFEV